MGSGNRAGRAGWNPNRPHPNRYRPDVRRRNPAATLAKVEELKKALDEIEQVSNQIASLVQNIYSSAMQQANSAADVTKRTARLGQIGEQTGNLGMTIEAEVHGVRIPDEIPV